MTSQDNISKVIAPGVEISSIYYDDLNSHKSSEDVIYDNRFVQNLTSMGMNSQGVQLVIPNEKIINEVILAMQFPGGGSSGNNLGLVPVPAYTIIQAIEWAVAGSTVYREEGIQHMWTVLADCETLEKRDEVVRLAGGIGSNNFTTNTTYYAHINTPWSKINGPGLKKKGIDSKLVTQPLRVIVYFRGGNSVYYQATGTPTIPNVFANAFWQIRQGDFSDNRHHLNLRPLVQNEAGQLVQMQNYYFYPFQFSQSFPSQIFSGSGASGTATSIPVTSFRKGNLQMIRATLYNLGGNSPLTLPAQSFTNYLQNEDPISLVILFNGTQIYRSDLDSFKMLGIENDKSPQFARTNVAGPSQYYIDIPFAKLLPKLNMENWQYGYDFSNQTIQASLLTQTTNNYIIYFTYIYHAHIMFDGLNAEVQF